ncbi:MAG TPA: hypothetical protein VNK52_16165 [Hyphomicrobiaceae bacterium]|nr:hypothetical protein [Hyphomicrobiaceae bacterium]
MPNIGRESQLALNAEYLLDDPPLAIEALAADAGTPVTSSSALSASELARLLRYEVQVGKVVHYAITPTGTVTAASTSHPTLQGRGLLQWGRGWRVSLLEASTP